MLVGLFILQLNIKQGLRFLENKKEQQDNAEEGKGPPVDCPCDDLLPNVVN